MMTATVEENELITRSKNGDRQAFGELVSLHQQGVINVVYRMSGDINHAEDAAQEAFVRAWQKLQSYRSVASFRAWIYRIAMNIAIDLLRREKPTENIDKHPVKDSSKGLEMNIIQRQKAETVKKAVSSLPTASRSVLVLREYESLSYQEIAETLEIPIGTVMSRLSYARKALRPILEELLEEV